MVAHLTLYEDILSSAASALMPATPRMLFVAHGELSICEQSLWDGGICMASQRSPSEEAKEPERRCGALISPGPRPLPCSSARGRDHRRLSAPLWTLPEGAPPARRQRRLSAWRLCLHPCPSRTQHTLPHRRRHPDRHAGPIDGLWSRRGLVREWAGASLRPGRCRPPEPICPRHDPAAQTARQELDPLCQ
jgi:hypothetical protein